MKMAENCKKIAKHLEFESSHIRAFHGGIKLHNLYAALAKKDELKDKY